MSRFVSTLKTDQVGKWTHTLIDDLVLADDDERTIVVSARFIAGHASKVSAQHFWIVRFGLRE